MRASDNARHLSFPLVLFFLFEMFPPLFLARDLFPKV